MSIILVKKNIRENTNAKARQEAKNHFIHFSTIGEWWEAETKKETIEKPVLFSLETILN